MKKLGKFLKLALLLITCLLYSKPSNAWEQETVNAFTKEVQKYSSKWSVYRSKEFLLNISDTSMYVDNVNVGDASNPMLVKITIIGKTILVDGKDISGNLGKTYNETHGDNSPIMNGDNNSFNANKNALSIPTRWQIGGGITLIIALIGGNVIRKKNKSKS